VRAAARTPDSPVPHPAFARFDRPVDRLTPFISEYEYTDYDQPAPAATTRPAAPPTDDDDEYEYSYEEE
jgi:hypothetical protein